jgi:hypothetical protein
MAMSGKNTSSAAAVIAMSLLLVCAHQRLRGSPWERALSTIRNSPTVDARLVGYSGARSHTYNAFAAMSQMATKEQLLGLAQDQHPNLKASAALALHQRYPDENFFDLLQSRIDDHSTFVFFHGCLQEKESMGNFYARLFSAKLSNAQKALFTIRVLNGSASGGLRSEVLRKWGLSEKHLPRLRELALQDEEDALIPLAKFRREEDNPIIIAAATDHPFEVYRAISLNPQPAFFSLLEQAHPALLAEPYHSTTQREFYAAVAAYKDPAALTILTRVLDGDEKTIPMREYQLAFIQAAVGDHPDAIYDALKWRFWEELHALSERDFAHLATLDAARATRSANLSLDGDVKAFSKPLLEAMFRLIGMDDPARVERVIARELQKCELHHYRFLSGLAGRNPRPAYIEPLFKAVETKDNPHLFLRAAEALMSFNNDEIRSRIAAAPAKNPKLLQGWGGEEFRKLLFEKVIVSR